MSDVAPFSQRHGLTPPDGPISVRAEAPDWMRDVVVAVAYKSQIKPSDLREVLCPILLETPDANNWTEFPNVDGEVRGLLRQAQWFDVYDFIEALVASLARPDQHEVRDRFTQELNAAFRRKGIGWQLLDGLIQVRGEESFEVSVKTALDLSRDTGRPQAHQELHEAVLDLSRRPTPDLTGAIQHAMAALECVARDLTGDAGVTLGEWLKKNPTAFPQPLGSAVEKLWGYTSQRGRHVSEGKPATADEAELVVGLAGALAVYLLRKTGSTAKGGS